MARSTQSHSVRQEGGQPFGLEGAKEMIIAVCLHRYLYYLSLKVREATGIMEQGIASPSKSFRRPLEAYGEEKKYQAVSLRRWMEPGEYRKAEREREKTKETSRRVPEGKSEQSQRLAPER